MKTDLFQSCGHCWVFQICWHIESFCFSLLLYKTKKIDLSLPSKAVSEWLHFHFHALEKKMETHSSVLAWRIPGTVEPGGLPSMVSHRVGHNWNDLAAAAAGLTQAWESAFLSHSQVLPLLHFQGYGWRTTWLDQCLSKLMFMMTPLEFSLRCKFSFNRTDVGPQIL